MEWWHTLVVMVGGIVLLMALGLPVAFAFLAVNAAAAWWLMGGSAGLMQLIGNGAASVSIYALMPVPVFLIMGELLFHSGLALRVLDALDKLLGRLPGRLCYLTVGGGTVFAALSGSSIANTAMMGSLMLPEMERRGYRRTVAMGPIMGAGALAIIIPPSGLAVLLGSIGKIDIAALLLGGVLPGLLLALLYIAVIAIQVRLDPGAAPAYGVERPRWAEVAKALARDVLPMSLVIFCVIGFMVFGWATPTEAAAFGALATLILAAAFRCLTLAVLRKAMVGTVRVTGMLFLIVFAAATFSQILAYSGAGGALVDWSVSFGLPPLTVVVCMLLVVVALGCFVDQLSIMLLTLPIYMPLLMQYGIDPVWFGVMFLIALETGLLTPPFGLLLFVMRGVAPPGTTSAEIVRAALPYLACAFVTIVAIALFPPLATYLSR